MPYQDRGEEGVHYVPFKDVKGISTATDGSTRFKLVGGPMHNYTMRVYPPYDTFWFQDGTTYELSPPLNPRKTDKWCYVSNPALKWGKPIEGEGHT
jgi:hypothetical protein